MPKIMRMNQDFRQGFADPEATQRFLQNPANWFFAALWEETVIGFAYGYALPRLNGSKNMLYLHEVGVAQRYQRQGIGMQMMCALQNICAKSNIGKIFLFTDSRNAPANALYRKL
ncbi:MAG TPA: GNAT family N-acetyltransferase, partial [Candidatus Ornithocaccomicrobium faecavium]|nr:GNAT family N-acetyltransferase [Candidatus Ornithocaccomicrobium faecavium]